MVGWYLVLVGFAAGMTVLVATACARVSPRWVRWALIGSGVITLSRYAAMATFAIAPVTSLPDLWIALLARAWFGTSIGLTLPTIVAIDQLVRHPAMTPKKLMQSYAPFLAAYLVVLVIGQVVLQPDPLIDQAPALVGWARMLLSVTQTVFVAAVLWFGVALARKIPSIWIRAAILTLMLAHTWLAVDGFILAFGGWYFRPFLWSEIVALAAIWFAFDTARYHPL